MKKRTNGHRKSISRVTQKEHTHTDLSFLTAFFHFWDISIDSQCWFFVYDIKSVTHQNTNRKSCRIDIVDELKIVPFRAHKKWWIAHNIILIKTKQIDISGNRVSFHGIGW